VEAAKLTLFDEKNQTTTWETDPFSGTVINESFMGPRNNKQLQSHQNGSSALPNVNHELKDFMN